MRFAPALLCLALAVTSCAASVSDATLAAEAADGVETSIVQAPIPPLDSTTTTNPPNETTSTTASTTTTVDSTPTAETYVGYRWKLTSAINDDSVDGVVSLEDDRAYLRMVSGSVETEYLLENGENYQGSSSAQWELDRLRFASVIGRPLNSINVADFAAATGGTVESDGAMSVTYVFTDDDGQVDSDGMAPGFILQGVLGKEPSDIVVTSANGIIRTVAISSESTIDYLFEIEPLRSVSIPTAASGPRQRTL